MQIKQVYTIVIRTHTHTHTLTHLVNVYTKLGDENNSHIDNLYLNIIK
jgi:hypothetical protein